jgi:hypothetical protein
MQRWVQQLVNYKVCELLARHQNKFKLKEFVSRMISKACPHRECCPGSEEPHGSELHVSKTLT